MLSNTLNNTNEKVDVEVIEEIVVEEKEDSESSPNVFYILQDDLVSEGLSKQYGCLLIDISKLNIRNDRETFQSTILTTDNLSIDISKFSEILVSCTLKDNQTNETRINLIKEYLILTMIEENELLSQGRICSFLNSSMRSIVSNYMNHKGLKYYKIRRGSVATDIPFEIINMNDKYLKEHKSIYRTMNNVLYVIIKFVIEFIKDMSKSIDELAAIDKKLISRARSLSLFINQANIEGFVNTVEEIKGDCSRNYLKIKHENNDEQSLKPTRERTVTKPFENGFSPPKKKRKSSKKVKLINDTTVNEIQVPKIWDSNGDHLLQSAEMEQNDSSQGGEIDDNNNSISMDYNNDQISAIDDPNISQHSMTSNSNHSNLFSDQKKDSNKVKVNGNQNNSNRTLNVVDIIETLQSLALNENEFSPEFLNQFSKLTALYHSTHSENLSKIGEDIEENEQEEQEEEEEEQEEEEDTVLAGLDPYYNSYRIDDIPYGLCANLIYLITNNESLFETLSVVIDDRIKDSELLLKQTASNVSIVCQILYDRNEERYHTSGVETIKVLELKRPRTTTEMIFPEITYDDLRSYYLKENNITAITNVIDVFFSIINLDIENNFDKKGIILPFHFVKVSNNIVCINDITIIIYFFIITSIDFLIQNKSKYFVYCHRETQKL